MKELNYLRNKFILVTGGAGFIGSNLCEFLLNLKCKVRCLDNLSTGYMHNINSLMSNNNFEFLNGDIRDLEVCQKACLNIDFVLHQAALGSVPRSINDPITSNEVNVNGFLNMLVASRDNKVKRFIYAASSSTYGDSTTLPKIECNIGKPLSPYAITKYINELYAENFKHMYNLDSVGLRYFNVFGRKQDPNGAYAAVIPKFISQLIHGVSPIVNGDGSFSRDFTHIDNVLNMNYLALTTKNSNALNQVYNTAVGDSTTLVQLINLLKKYLSDFNININKIKIIHGPNRIGDIPHSLASVAKASKMLKYIPSVNIENGIQKSIHWYWNNLK